MPAPGVTTLRVSVGQRYAGRVPSPRPPPGVGTVDPDDHERCARPVSGTAPKFTPHPTSGGGRPGAGAQKAGSYLRVPRMKGSSSSQAMAASPRIMPRFKGMREARIRVSRALLVEDTIGKPRQRGAAARRDDVISQLAESGSANALLALSPLGLRSGFGGEDGQEAAARPGGTVWQSGRVTSRS